MRRVFIFLSVTAIALVIGASAFAGGAAVASAQETAENNTHAASNDSTVQFSLDDDVRVLDVSYQSYEDRPGGRLEVDVENNGDSSETVHVVEIVEAGAESWGWASPRIRAGETTTIVVEGVPDRGGDPAAMIASETGLDEQNVQWITTGESMDWFPGPATWGLTGLAVVSGGYATFWGTRRRIEKQEDELEERQTEVVR